MFSANKFPILKPVVEICPVECAKTQKKACSKTVTGYNFEVDDEVDKMVSNLTECLPENVNKFKDHKH